MANWTAENKNTSTFTGETKNSLQDFRLLEDGNLRLLEDGNIRLLEGDGSFGADTKNSASWTAETKN